MTSCKLLSRRIRWSIQVTNEIRLLTGGGGGGGSRSNSSKPRFLHDSRRRRRRRCCLEVSKRRLTSSKEDSRTFVGTRDFIDKDWEIIAGRPPPNKILSYALYIRDSSRLPHAALVLAVVPCLSQSIRGTLSFYHARPSSRP